MTSLPVPSDSLRQDLSFGIVGYGQFGQFIHRLLGQYAPDNPVAVFPGVAGHPDLPPTTLADVAGCDAVFLAVPISAYEEVLTALIPHLSPETVVIDVATVKVHTARLFQRLNLPCRYLSTHPMFGPESFRKMHGALDGFRIVVTEHNLPVPDYTAIAQVIEGLGIRIIETSADDHDRDLAETLFLTHYVGQVIANAGFLRTRIDTVSFGFLMDAVDSVRNDGALFDQVVRYNPYCANVIERFDRSDREIRRKMLAQSSANRSDGIWYSC